MTMKRIKSGDIPKTSPERLAELAARPDDQIDFSDIPERNRPVTIEVKVRLQALAVPEAAGGYSILVPALPGCVSQAGTIEEVQANVVEAAEGWLASMHDHNKDEDLRVARGESKPGGTHVKSVTMEP
jgi:antitoxin HicB